MRLIQLLLVLLLCVHPIDSVNKFPNEYNFDNINLEEAAVPDKDIWENKIGSDLDSLIKVDQARPTAKKSADWEKSIESSLDQIIEDGTEMNAQSIDNAEINQMGKITMYDINFNEEMSMDFEISGDWNPALDLPVFGILDRFEDPLR